MDYKDATILIVDDEINNVRLLQDDLSDAGYSNLLTARNGEETLEILTKRSDEIQLVLLDRMMPNMDGMEVMARMQQDSNLSHIPVIMQTAAAAKEQMLEGIDAGVYYYLTKPYDEDTMLAIVGSALRNHEEYRGLLRDAFEFKRKVHLVKESSFEIQTLDDARYLATFLANFFPEPYRVVLGLSELFVNAIEHGNLGISYEEKLDLVQKGSWEDEVERRLELKENLSKFAQVHYRRTPKEIAVEIEDEGPGFDWQKYLEISADRATHPHGRGIALAKMMSFDEVEYLEPGNKVRCVVAVSTRENQLAKAMKERSA